jgi:flagellar protein FlbD
MLLLSKLDHTRVLVPLESIKYIEETPDTLIRFLNGESVIVRESFEVIQNLVRNSRATETSQKQSSNYKEEQSIQSN